MASLIRSMGQMLLLGLLGRALFVDDKSEMTVEVMESTLRVGPRTGRVSSVISACESDMSERGSEESS